MANIKSAKKRALQTKVRTERNKVLKERVRTFTRSFEDALAKQDKDSSVLAFNKVQGSLAKASKKGIFHKNTIARKISRLSKKLAKLA